MHNVYDFVKWALTHVDPKTVVNSGSYPLPSDEIGVEPVHYLFGTVWKFTNDETLNERFDNYYSDRMSRERYDALTKDWKPTDHATDCQGLLDAWLTYEAGEKTDWNADYNYKYVCEEKGKIADIDRPYVIGEALFIQSKTSGKMTHIGWVCGFAENGEALAVEARNIEYGVVITRVNSRSWTHRGLMTKRFDYTPPKPEPVEKAIFEARSPMLRGAAYLAMQQALNEAGYIDYDGRLLDEDGIWGKRSQYAFDALIADYAKPVEVPLLMEFTATSDNGYSLKATVAKLKDKQEGAAE